MDITLKTDIAGYFSYKIYRDTPENIIYESELQKNLIVDSGLTHLYSISVPEAMRILDLGNSGIAASPADTGLKGASFNNSSIFNDLSALYLTGGYIADDLASEYTAFFRTKTTSSPTILKEFVIKPGPNQNAFARQVFNPITLQAGDGIEFTYEVKVNWGCSSSDAKLKLYYSKKVEGDVNSFEDNQLPLTWKPVRVNSVDKLWTNISYGNNNVVAIACAKNNSNAGVSNIEYSTDLGVSWLSADSPTDATYYIDKPLNDVTFGNIIDGAGEYVPKFVAIGLSALYTSETGAVWLSGNVASNNWTGIAFGTPSNNPLFVAVSNSGSNRVVKSSDTINWSTVNSSVTNSINWSAITYGRHYVAVADSGSYRIAYSTDGQSWLSAAAPALNEWCDIAYSFERDLYVAVSRNATYSPIMYASGGDLTKWYPSRSPYSASWHGITHGNGLFVAVGESPSQSRAIYSVDGIDWFPVSFISFNEVWKSVVFANDTFIAVASSTSYISEPFARSEVLPRSGGAFEIDSKIAQLSITDSVYSQESYMYTLRDFDVPVGCSVSPTTAEELLYSTTLPYNSYVKATTSLISPNTAVSIYKFNSTTGHGVIKNLLITNNVLLTGYKTPGLWAIELDADPQLADPIVYTGTLDNIVTLSPEAGSITRSISSTIGDITQSELQFNVYHTWGPNRPIMTNTISNITITNTASSTVALETRPYADAVIPSWTVIDTNNYLSGYYSNHTPFDAGIFPNSFEEIGQDCRGSSFTVENALIFELKSNIILPTIGRDSIAGVYKPSVRSSYRYTADAIISELQTVNSATSAQTVDIFNTNQIAKTELINDIINSARSYGIQDNFIDDIVLSQVNGRAVMRIIFNKNSSIIPDYVNVNTQTIDSVDSSCVDSSSNSYAGPAQSVTTSRFDVIIPA